MLRKILNQYRKIQYKIFGRERFGIMPNGEECRIEDINYSITHSDVVHPCIRYIPEAFRNHKWWMVYTPYYQSSASIENPILCYGESDNEIPPKSWKFYTVISEGHTKGYNSDPNLLYEDGKLHVFWRENQTDNCINNNYSRITHKKTLTIDHISETNKQPLLYSKREEIDYEVSPAFIKEGDFYIAYATVIKFFSPTVRRLPKFLRRISNGFLTVIDLLGGKPVRQDFGIATWCARDVDSKFELKMISKFKCKNKLYHPWHLDIFSWKGDVYAIIQSNQCNADIILAKRDEFGDFIIYKKPLLTNATIGKVGIYKPTALVINGIFILYYTAQDVENRSLNKLYVTTFDFEKVLIELK